MFFSPQILVKGGVRNTRPVNTVVPSVTGTLNAGDTLSCTSGTWIGTPTIIYTYQWYQADTAVPGVGPPLTDGDGNYIGTPISAATNSTYVLQAGDAGQIIFCDVIATNSVGATVKSSNYVGPIVIAYIGVGDIKSGAFAFWGWRAYSAATIGNNCVRIKRASDAAEMDFVTVAGGGVDVAGITTFLAATTGKVVTLYDQTGNGNDVTQATGAKQLVVDLAVLGSYPSSKGNGGQSLATTSTVGLHAQPYTFSALAKRTGAFTSFGFLIGSDGVNAPWLAFSSATNTVEIFGGSAETTVTASDSTWHSLDAVFNGASSNIYIDGASNPVSPGTGSITDLKLVFAAAENAGGDGLTGYEQEAVIWLATTSGAEAAAISTNRVNFWGY